MPVRSIFRTAFAAMIGVSLALAPWAVGPSSAGAIPPPPAPRYPHEAHGYRLALSRLQENRAALDWVGRAEEALLHPLNVQLPFSTDGRLSASEAAGYAFAVPAGRQLSIEVTSGPGTGELFVDVFKREGGRQVRVTGSLPRDDEAPLQLDVLEAGDYVLRAQAALGGDANFGVVLRVAPLLAFPVAGVDQRAIWSGFGAERDGGRRAHRGVDIFAARGTPALAAFDAWVTRVETTRVGGNVVWLTPLFGGMRLYYAHLSEQWVEPGQFVRAGQPLGAVGNTGNAVTTPPHLHFGVYVRQPGVRGGARDPAEFLR